MGHHGGGGGGGGFGCLGGGLGGFLVGLGLVLRREGWWVLWSCWERGGWVEICFLLRGVGLWILGSAASRPGGWVCRMGQRRQNGRPSRLKVSSAEDLVERMQIGVCHQHQFLKDLGLYRRDEYGASGEVDAWSYSFALEE